MRTNKSIKEIILQAIAGGMELSHFKMREARRIKHKMTNSLFEIHLWSNNFRVLSENFYARLRTFPFKNFRSTQS